ncbi:MAG: XrtA system polysaccharide deacetylase [Candidatus Binatia bacterium]
MRTTGLINALTIDVEDYYHVSAFESVVGFDKWTGYESRVQPNVEKILKILDGRGIHATFFILGWVGEHFPAVVRLIHKQGHEIATHGYAHRLIYSQTPEEFQADVERSLDILENITGEKVKGYRAPSFSVTPKSLWAIEILQAAGLRYDSSVCPARPLVHRRYGFPGAPTRPYQIAPGFWEFPVSTFRAFGRDFPVGGGGWLRHYPFGITRWGLRRINFEGRPALVYVHPWEVDPDQPRLQGNLWRKFLHYRNLKRTAERLEVLCRDFRFASIRDILQV